MKNFQLILLFLLSTSSLAAMGHREFDEELFLSNRIAQQILASEYKKALLTGGVVIGMKVATGLCLNMALESYKALKNTFVRTVWGPTKEDMVYAISVQKNRQDLAEQALSLLAANRKLDMQHFEQYKKLMHVRMNEAKDENEKQEIEKTFIETQNLFLKKMAAELLADRSRMQVRQKNQATAQNASQAAMNRG